MSLRAHRRGARLAAGLEQGTSSSISAPTTRATYPSDLGLSAHHESGGDRARTVILPRAAGLVIGRRNSAGISASCFRPGSWIRVSVCLSDRAEQVLEQNNGQGTFGNADNWKQRRSADSEHLGTGHSFVFYYPAQTDLPIVVRIFSRRKNRSWRLPRARRIDSGPMNVGCLRVDLWNSCPKSPKATNHKNHE